jgi:glycosyltransferase involved in cell wall biosynthesis
MTRPQRLRILNVSQIPASPPRFGAQARMHGLMTGLARDHDLTAMVLVDGEFDLEESRRAMEAYCREVVLVRSPFGEAGPAKRLLQARSLFSGRSFERLRVTVPEFERQLYAKLRTAEFDIVNLEATFLGHYDFFQSPPGAARPRFVVDSHNIDYDLARQYAKSADSLVRRIYAGVNWRKLMREELGTYRGADGVYLCSVNDERRLLEAAPGVTTTVIPNAADVEYYRPRPSDPEPDGRTVVFFGLMSYVPNVDGVQYFVETIWPRVMAQRPDARLKIIGRDPPASVKALARQGIEVTGFVEDLRPHLAAASVTAVPLRLGGGTRLKIVEAMAMGKAIVSTSLGAEGIEAVSGRDLVIADQPMEFANAVLKILNDRTLAARLGTSARQLAVDRYSWADAARRLEAFYHRVLSQPANRAAQ